MHVIYQYIRCIYLIMVNFRAMPVKVFILLSHYEVNIPFHTKYCFQPWTRFSCLGYAHFRSVRFLFKFSFCSWWIFKALISFIRYTENNPTMSSNHQFSYVSQVTHIIIYLIENININVFDRFIIARNEGHAPALYSGFLHENWILCTFYPVAFCVVIKTIWLLVWLLAWRDLEHMLITINWIHFRQVVLYETTSKRSRSKFFDVERIIERRKRPQVRY
jgi:hypothetical protein